MIDHPTLSALLTAHGLGDIDSITQPSRGAINLCYIINDRYVIRFETLPEQVGSRFDGEALAYQRLQGSDIPVPEVIALDTSKTRVPFPYIIMTKVEGVPLIDAWGTLNDSERQSAAFQAGEYLAWMGDITFTDGFYTLCDRALERYLHWRDYIAAYAQEYFDIFRVSGGFSEDEIQTVRAALDAARPLLNRVFTARLVHGDFHFENLLYDDGRVTGIIDFEHAKAGDPLWEFRIEEQWDGDCPGSRAPITAGYTSVRPFTDEDRQRVTIYKMVQALDNIDWFIKRGEPDHVEKARWAAFEHARGLLKQD